jgi:hypothetical protein
MSANRREETMANLGRENGVSINESGGVMAK